MNDYTATTNDYAERMPPTWAEAIARSPNPYDVSLADMRGRRSRLFGKSSTRNPTTGS